MEYIDKDGCYLEYIDQGEGPVILVIGSAKYYNRTFNKDLYKNFRMIFLDHRGFAQTNNNKYIEPDLLLDILIEDIEFCRKALELESFILLGHSGHGYLAIEYAKKYCQYVQKLVLVAMSPDSTQKSFNAADRYLEDSVCPERKEIYNNDISSLEMSIAQNPNKRFVLYSLLSKARIWYDYTYDASWLWQNVHLNSEILDLVWGKIFKELNILKNIKNLSMPVLVLLGRYDYWNPPFLWENVRDEFIDITIRVFEKSAHTPQLEQSEDFIRELKNWLEKKP
ncbi:alpha/beta hydrolase [bacterium]|nr:alpha/beta hydrolase [bacterium]